MQLTSHTIYEGEALPAVHAMGVRKNGFDAMGVPVPLPAGAQPGPNCSPHLAWSEAPSTARSFAVTCVDQDAPSDSDAINQPGRTVPYEAPRSTFVHWLLVDIPGSVTELHQGIDANGVTPHGKPPEKTAHGVRGLNDFTSFFEGDEQFEGVHAGYDGPWPPSNDERRHRYVFTVYALDVPSLGFSGAFTLEDAQRAMRGHKLAEASLCATYAIYEEAH